MKEFYTYLWLREDGTPYYVGKGTGRRAFQDGGRSVHLPKDHSRIKIQEWSDETTAFAFEMYLVDFWGRKDLETGCLRNRTDGGNGPVGFSSEARDRISATHKGRKLSPEHRFKISEANKEIVRPHMIGRKHNVGKHWALSMETRQRMAEAQISRRLREHQG